MTSGAEHPPRAVVIWTSLGPPHVARVRALVEESDFDITLLGLCSTEELRSWSLPILEGIQAEILFDQGYEDVDRTQLERKLFTRLDEIAPDIIVLPGYGEAVIRQAARWASKRGVATVLLSASQRSDRTRFAPVEKLKGRWIQTHFDSAFVGGERATAYLADLGFPRERIWRIFSVVDGGFFAEQAQKIRLEEEKWTKELQLDRPYFLYVGRFSPEKNLQTLLRAYQTYRGISPEPWSLTLVGDGPEADRLREFVATAGVEGVRLVGFKQVDELPAYYGLASCFILPSLSEPWGLVVNEAMASGLPLLVSNRCGATGDLVFQGLNGYVFDPNDPDRLAQLMERMSADPDRAQRMGDASRNIVSIYTPQNWGRAMADCLEVTLLRKATR